MIIKKKFFFFYMVSQYNDPSAIQILGINLYVSLKNNGYILCLLLQNVYCNNQPRNKYLIPAMCQIK